MVPFWEKREADQWASLKVVIDGVESEAAWSIMAKDVPEFMKEDSQRALSFEVFEKDYRRRATIKNGKSSETGQISGGFRSRYENGSEEADPERNGSGKW